MLTLYLIVSLVLFLFYKIFISVISRIRLNRLMSKFSGPTGWPFFGPCLELSTTDDLLPTLIKFQRKYGEIFKLKIGSKYAIFTSDCKLIETVLTNTNTFVNKSHTYGFLQKWLGLGVLINRDEQWRKRRKVMELAFNIKTEQILDITVNNGNKLIQKLKHNVEKESFDIYPYLNYTSLSILYEILLGTTINDQDDSNLDYLKAVDKICRLQMERSLNPFKKVKFLNYFTRDYFKERNALRILHNFTSSVIRRKIKELETKKYLNVEDGGENKMCFLDSLLTSKVDGKMLTEEAVREEVDTFLFTGLQTVSLTLGYTLFMISKHEDVQQRIVEEINLILGGDKERSLSCPDLEGMKYLECVIKETMRLYPVVPLYGRNTQTDIIYEDKVIPKNTSIYIFAYGMHRLSTSFTNPEIFHPERFMNLNQDDSLSYSYIPFSAGLRNCIGQNFAMLEMKLIISMVVRYYRLFTITPQHELVLCWETLLKSKNGIYLCIKERN